MIMGRNHTEESKKKISEGRKAYLLLNPDKHPWWICDRFKSVPCEIMKSKLKASGITFVEEYKALTNRSYSIDIAFPNEKIAMEINGNQHYERNGELKPYYKSRHERLKLEGWKIYEIHYSKVYDENFCDSLISALKLNHDLGKIDYSFYIKKRKSYTCKDCGKDVCSQSIRCKKCDCLFRIKENMKSNRYPSLEELEKLVSENGFCGAGRILGVSDNAVRKRIKSYKNHL